MQLYHYRSIENALLEIKGTFHFSARKELNDPIEGYVRVFWQGDKAAWEGLLRNYICSVSNAISLYLLQGDEEMLHHRTLITNLHKYDNVPLGRILKELGDTFLVEEEIKHIITLYGDNNLKVTQDELCFILQFIHNKALILCIEKCLECKTISEEQGNMLLEMFGKFKNISFPFSLKTKELFQEEHRAQIARVSENIIEDMREFEYVMLGLDDESFSYGKHDENTMLRTTEARQHRNWMAVTVDFPKVYVDQLLDMIYPESFVVCFSGKNNDSSMWGNYADNHRGVCLVYDTDEQNNIALADKIPNPTSIKAKPVCYGGDLIERNFFETLGRLTLNEIRTWLTGTDSVSSCYNAFSNVDCWRDRYWEVNEAKTYRKLKAWDHENEYRIAITNLLGSYDDPKSRNIKYDSKGLKGIIFGLKTSENDKKRIMEELLKKSDVLEEFTFYQAEYDSRKQSIEVRKKTWWTLKEDYEEPINP